jgi:hypothetical protein
MQILSDHVRAFGAGLLILVFMYTLSLLRANKLSPQHATSWIVAELAMLALILFGPASAFITRLTGAEYALPVVLLLATTWGILLMLDLLVRISDLNAKLRAVNQELALLGERFERLQKTVNAAADSEQKKQG